MRVAIIQDEDKLINLYAHRLDYDLNSPGFTEYVTKRTGICEPHKWLDCNVEPKHQHQFITQLKIQSTFYFSSSTVSILLITEKVFFGVTCGARTRIHLNHNQRL